MKYFFYLSLLLTVMASCKQSDPEPFPDEAITEENEVVLTPAQYKNAGIDTGRIGSQAISSILKVSGSIDVPPQNIVSVSVPLGGYLRHTKLLPGMQVRKGEVLAIVEDPQYIQLQQDYLTAKARFTYLEDEYQRQQTLNKSQSVSNKLLEQSRAEWQTQLILIKSLEQKLMLTGIRPADIHTGNISRSIRIFSPINGFVSAVNMNIGKYVSPTDVLFELIDPSDIHLALTIFEKDISQIFIGQKLMAYTNSNPSRKYPGTVLLISKNLSADRASEVHCHFDTYDPDLLPGMFMNAEIRLGGMVSNAVPEEAVVRYENRLYVFRLMKPRHFVMQEVQTGLTENGFVQILSGSNLPAGPVAVKGAYNLLMALKNKDEG